MTFGVFFIQGSTPPAPSFEMIKMPRIPSEDEPPNHFTSQALINHGGDAWREYNQIVRDELLENQKTDGSWPILHGTSSHADPVYSTALATLILEVYYRYLPGTGAKK